MGLIWRSRDVWRLMLLALLGNCAAAVLPAAEGWQIDTVDSGFVGRYASMKADREGNLHLAYVLDDDRYSLKYAFWDHNLSRWFTMLVDQHASFCSLTLDSKQRPHIAYADHGTMPGARLHYAYWDGETWKKQAIDIGMEIIGYYTSIVLDAADRPIISFYDYMGPGQVNVFHLRTVFWRQGRFWEVMTVDSDPGAGKFNSITLDRNGNPQIAYSVVLWEHASLRYARWNGKAWERQIIEGATEPVPVYSVAEATDKYGNPSIAYMDVQNRIAKYAILNGSTWQTESIDSLARVGYPDRNGIVIDEDGQPYVTYADSGTGLLKLAHKQRGRWIIEVLDQNVTAATSSIEISSGNIWVSYADEGNQALKCAHKAIVRVAGSSSER